MILVAWSQPHKRQSLSIKTSKKICLYNIILFTENYERDNNELKKKFWRKREGEVFIKTKRSVSQTNHVPIYQTTDEQCNWNRYCNCLSEMLYLSNERNGWNGKMEIESAMRYNMLCSFWYSYGMFMHLIKKRHTTNIISITNVHCACNLKYFKHFNGLPPLQLVISFGSIVFI